MNLREMLTSLEDGDRIAIMQAFNAEEEYVIQHGGHFLACHLSPSSPLQPSERAGYWSFGTC